MVQLGTCHGFAEKFSRAADGIIKSLELDQVYMHAAPFVVCLSSYNEFKMVFTCSGTIIEWRLGYGYILTTASLLQGHCSNKLVVKIQLSNNKDHLGMVSHYDLHRNIAIIKFASTEPLQVATLDIGACPSPGDKVLAMARHYEDSELMCSHGEVLRQSSELDCEELMLTNCLLSKPGVGGPLLNPQNGHIVGMNFYGERCMPFLPCSIIMRCLNHLYLYGRVIQPWLGLQVQSFQMLELDELEKKSREFCKLHGLVVKKVLKKSPAKIAGIQPGDIITYCNGRPVHSILELSSVLLDMSAIYPIQATLPREKNMQVEVLLQREGQNCNVVRFFVADQIKSANYNRWPFPEEKRI